MTGLDLFFVVFTVPVWFFGVLETPRTSALRSSP